MKIKLPKSIVGVKFPRICTIEMNNFDIDQFLPSLFFTILAQGRGRARQVNDPKAIAQFIDSLAQHPALQGFSDQEGRKLLERFVRTALITTGAVGRSRIAEQITSIVPYTLLAHKPGFPTSGSRQRGADTFIYQILRENLGDDNLRSFTKTVFGKGVNIKNPPELGGEYDSTSELDTLTRFSLAFIDGFKNIRTSLNREKNATSPCPALAKEFASDLLRYLFEYHKTMPTQAFTHHLLILINFELFSYTLKLVQAVNELVGHPENLPAAMRDPLEASLPQLYLDFTESSNEKSQEMAKACVQRDVETYQQFLESNLLLRLLDHYVAKLQRNPRKRAIIEKRLSLEPTAEYLQGLLLLQNDPEVSRDFAAFASNDEDEIRQLNMHEEDEDNPEASNWLDAINDTAEDEIERLIALLVEAQRGDAVKHFIQWYQDVGGLKKPQGILRGMTRSRRSWRYAPTNDLLAVFVQLAAVRLGRPTKQEQGESVQPIRLQDFLRFLEERFGILVDRPPEPFEGAEYTAAARENLRAMLRRLRQMGIFRDLSDDFTVQRLHPPYADQEMTGARV